MLRGHATLCDASARHVAVATAIKIGIVVVASLWGRASGRVAMPTLDQFKNGIFVAGSCQGAAPTAPILRDSAGNAFSTMAAPPNGTHFSLSFPPAAPAPRPPASVATTPFLSERLPPGAHAPRINLLPKQNFWMNESFH
jgi:hypothetical protein